MTNKSLIVSWSWTKICVYKGTYLQQNIWTYLIFSFNSIRESEAIDDFKFIIMSPDW